MAMIDYGAIALKNGKLLTEEMFGEMKDMVGWEDTEEDVYYLSGEPIHLKGRYFSYIGDEKATIAFYKTYIKIIEYDEKNSYFMNEVDFGYSDFKWSKWKRYIGHSIATVKEQNGYYVLRWKYNGDKYKVYFGHGVDMPYYLKTKRVNFYRSFNYLFKKLIRNIKSLPMTIRDNIDIRRLRRIKKKEQKENEHS